jgi:site-specific recombinase XerD
VFLVLKSAAKNAGILKNVHPHTLRHSFATHLTENGYDVGTLQSLLGHVDSGTTMQYIHMVQPKVLSVQSPFDSL